VLCADVSFKISTQIEGDTRLTMVALEAPVMFAVMVVSKEPAGAKQGIAISAVEGG
jgi:hypothetical protein